MSAILKPQRHILYVASNKIMRRKYWAIIGISVPLALFGIMVLVIADNLNQINSNSDKWMVEVAHDKDLSKQQLSLQINEDLEKIHIYRIQTLEKYFTSLTPNFEKQFKDAINTEHRFVAYVDKNSGYSDEQIQEMLTDVTYITDAKDLHEWLLRGN